MTPQAAEELFQRARNGDRNALGDLLEQFRDMLRGTAQQELSPRLKVRVDASDVVQATFLEVARDIDAFRGEELAQFVAWLQQILKNNILQSVEMHKLAQKRSIDRERRLDGLIKSGFACRNQFTANQSTPSQRIQREEHARRLLAAIESLPLYQKDVTRMRFLEGMSLEEIAEALTRSKTAVAGLLKRGMRKLRQEFADELDKDPS